MIASWKLVRTSIAVSACLGLLAACQDRGAFKSKSWTPEQIKANLAAKNAKEQREASADSNTPTNAPVAPNPAGTGTGTDDGKGGVKAQGENTPDKPAGPQANGQAGTVTGEGTGTGSAQGQGITEPIDADRFILDNIQLITQADPMAAKILKGLTVDITGSPGSLSVAIDAGILLGADLRWINVAPTKMMSADKDKKVQKLAYTVKTVDADMTEVKVNEQQVKILAACKNAACDELHIRIKVQVDSGSSELAIVAAQTGANKYEVIKINVPSFKSYKEFSESMDKKPEENKDGDKTATKPAAPVTTPATVTSEGQGQGVANGGANGPVATTPAATNTPTATVPATTAPAASATATPPQALPAATTTAVPVAPVKSVVFKPTAETSSKPKLNLPALDAPALVTLKPVAKPLTLGQDPGPFTLNPPAAKAPGIFGSTAGLTRSAIAAPATTPVAATGTPVLDDSAQAEKDNQALRDVLKKEADEKAAKAKADQDAIEGLSMFYN